MALRANATINNQLFTCSTSTHQWPVDHSLRQTALEIQNTTHDVRNMMFDTQHITCNRLYTMDNVR